MDLLSSFAFLATAQKAAPVPETLEIKGLADNSQPFRALMKVPAGPGEAAPQVIGQKLVLPGDAGKGLPQSGQSLPESMAAGNDVVPVADKHQLPDKRRAAPVTSFESTPGFFGKDRIEAFAAPAPRSDAPAEVPDNWSGRADYVREKFAFLGPPEQWIDESVPGSAKLTAGLLPSEAGITAAEPGTDEAARLINQPALPVADLPGHSPAPALAATPVHKPADVLEDSFPGRGAGVSLDDFPQAATAVLPGETGKHPSPWLATDNRRPYGGEVRANPGATSGELTALSMRSAETGPVPVLRRKVRIQTPDGGLGTRVEIARTPASYSVATAPVRPPETGNPNATYRAQALVDAMPRIRTHRRIDAGSMGTAGHQGAERATTSVEPGNVVQAGSGAGKENILAPGAPQERATNGAASAGSAALQPAATNRESAIPVRDADRAESPQVKAQPVLPDVQVNTIGRADLARKVTVHAQTSSTANGIPQAPVVSRPATEGAPAMPAASLAQPQGPVTNPQSVGAGLPAGGTASQPDGSSQRITNTAAAREPGLRPLSAAAAPPADLATVPTKGSGASAELAIRAGLQASAQPEIAARFATALNKLEDSSSTRMPRFVTDKGAVVESIRIASADTSFSAAPPSANPGGIATDPAAPQFRLPASPGGEPWSQALGERVVLMLRGGQQTARLLLNPEHLGALEVQVKVQDEQAMVTLQTQSAQAREALESALPRLREMLAEQGLDLARDSGSQERRAQDSARDSQRRDSGADWQQAKADEAPGDNQENRRGGHDGLLDRYI